MRIFANMFFMALFVCLYASYAAAAGHSQMSHDQVDHLYVVDFGYYAPALKYPSSIYECEISDASSTCKLATPSIYLPTGIRWNASGTYAYVATGNSQTTVEMDVFSPTSDEMLTDKSQNYISSSGGTGITVNDASTFIYIADNYGSKVLKCPTNSIGWVGSDQCISLGTFARAGTVALDAQTNSAYIPNMIDSTNNFGVTRCTIDANGAFTDCQKTSLDSHGSTLPSGSVLSAKNHYLYVAAMGQNGIYKCDLDPTNGVVKNCALQKSDTFLYPYDVALNHDSTILYVANFGNMSRSLTPGNISRCHLDSNGNIKTCTVISGNFKQPISISMHNS